MKFRWGPGEGVGQVSGEVSLALRGALAFSKPPLKLKSKISAPLNHAEQKHMSNPLKKGHF